MVNYQARLNMARELLAILFRLIELARNGGECISL